MRCFIDTTATILSTSCELFGPVAAPPAKAWRRFADQWVTGASFPSQAPDPTDLPHPGSVHHWQAALAATLVTGVAGESRQQAAGRIGEDSASSFVLAAARMFTLQAVFLIGGNQ